MLTVECLNGKAEAKKENMLLEYDNREVMNKYVGISMH